MSNFIVIKNAKENNLKGIDIHIPKNKITAITGVSGSGKSTIAFNIVYSEGKRCYLESLSTYARQFFGIQEKPDIESISGLSPTIAINQKSYSFNTKSTVSTVTEIYDYIRLLFSKIGVIHSIKTGKPLIKYSIEEIIENINSFASNQLIYILSPIESNQEKIEELKKEGFVRIRKNNNIISIYDCKITEKDTVEILIDRIHANDTQSQRTRDALNLSLSINKDEIFILIESEGKIEKTIYFPTNIKTEEIETRQEITPWLFSFYNPSSVCDLCKGTGKSKQINIKSIIPDKSKSIEDGAISPFFNDNMSDHETKIMINVFSTIAEKYQFSLKKSWKDLPEKIHNIILYGDSDIFEGIIPILTKFLPKYTNLIKNNIEKYEHYDKCSNCNGYRLNKNALCVKINNKHIGQINSMCINDAIKFFANLFHSINDQNKKISESIIFEIQKRLLAIKNIGIDYLTLDREASTLSGGEAQRIRIISHIGSNLSGITYILDEPSIGLHYKESNALIKMIKNLKNLGNTILIVEHDEKIISNADHIIEIGPMSGKNGGQITAHGTLEEIKKNPNSITGQYLSGKMKIIPTKKRLISDKKIQIFGITKNNVENLNVSIPLNCITCVTGASGSGKSTIFIDTLGEYIKNSEINSNNNICFEKICGTEYIQSVINIDNNMFNKTNRSTPATYINIFNDIRDIFASQPESKAFGYNASNFSYNSKEGQCKECEGHGVIKIEMHFLSDISIICESCNGTKYNKDSLRIKYKGKSIADIMNMTVDESIQFFQNFHKIKNKLELLQKTGLGYLKIGQSSSTLSGGEIQRMKIAKELSKANNSGTLYIMDEPTTGLHTHDVKKLIEIINNLVENGNTVILIEHNINIIKNSDYIIEIGIGGGKNGGKIIAEGSIDEIIKNPKSIIREQILE